MRRNVFGKKVCKRAFIGLLFGKIGLNNLLKDETPIQQNSPTSPEFNIREMSGDISAEKAK